MSKGGTDASAACGRAGPVVTPGRRADTGGRVADDVAVGGGTAAAPGVGVGVGSAISLVGCALSLLGSGEFGRDGGMC